MAATTSLGPSGLEGREKRWLCHRSWPILSPAASLSSGRPVPLPAHFRYGEDRRWHRDQAQGCRLHAILADAPAALLGEEVCNSPEEFKAWSQNLGHEQVLSADSGRFGSLRLHALSPASIGVSTELTRPMLLPMTAVACIAAIWATMLSAS